MKTLIAVLLLCLTSTAQTLAVVDDSPSDSPIRIGGTVTFDSAGNPSCAITGHNFAPKIVVAWRQDIEASFPNGGYTLYKSRHDHFFIDEVKLEAKSPQANSDFDPSNIDCSMFSTQNWTSTKPPGISVRNFWVQFIDGSTWGDPAHPDEQGYMIAQRTNAVAFLNKLKTAYSSGGPARFNEALDGFDAIVPRNQLATQELNEAHTTQLQLKMLPDLAAQLAEVNRMLSVAAARSNWMK